LDGQYFLIFFIKLDGYNFVKYVIKGLSAHVSPI